ncbi:MAG TPA: S41 family peptidase [Rhizomicrobium sp.]|jgi:hypothetical protein|nr:S41 family peptidase [Rhizomicrobium sp.]
MRNGFLTATITLAALGLACAAHAATFDRAAWQSDYAYLKTALEKTDANLAWLGSPQSGVDLPDLDRRTQAALSTAQSDADAKQAILAFVAGVHDGHFSELPYLEAAPAKPVSVPDPVLDQNDPVGGCAALGFALVQRTSFSTPFEALPGFHLEADGVQQDYRAGTIVMPDNTKLGIVRISWFRQQGFPSACQKAWAQLRKDGTTVSDSNLGEKTAYVLFAEIADQLKRFKAEGVQAVIVDVGSNTGGNDAGDFMARFFTDKPVYSARLMMATAPGSAGYFDDEIDALKKALTLKPTPLARKYLETSLAQFERGKASLDKPRCDLSWVWREQRSWNLGGCTGLTQAGSAGGPLRYLPAHAIENLDIVQALHWPAMVRDYWGAWTGPVYVLTNHKTYSSAEMFSAVTHDNGIARTVGETTGGDGCGFMTDAEPVVLPHSRLRFRIPNCVRLRADGTDEVAGIAPDLPVLPEEGEDDNVHAWRVLQAVTSDLHR